MARLWTRKPKASDQDAARAEITRLYEERFGNYISEENSSDLLLDLLDDPASRPLVLRAYPELAATFDD